MASEQNELVCPSCGGELVFSHEDDVGQKFFKCKKCGKSTTTPFFPSAEKKEEGPAEIKKRIEKPEKRCADCLLWMTPACSFIYDAKKGILKREDAACPEFCSKQGTKKEKKRSQADKLIELCLSHNPTLFHDQHKTSYIRIQQSSVNITLRIRSKPFKMWLASLLWEDEEKAPGTEAVYSALNVIGAKALFNGPKHTLYNRIAPAPDGFWIDMADDKWRAIEVTAKGWHIEDNPPIIFKRYSHQLPLVEPKQGGDPWKFLDFINIKKNDEATRLTLLSDVITFLIPLIPHVIIVVYGIQGSGKTMLFKLIKQLIDPSAVDVLTLPRNERERVQQLDHHWCAFYDNVTNLPSWMSDTLCRAATGGGFTKRELYTDDEDVIYNFKRCIGLNGINIAAQRGDLLDRSLLVGLADIPKEKRKTEKQLLAEFEKYKAEILGGFLDTLVKALQVYPSINPKELFRMADFTRWGCAIAVALGKTQDEFINAYETKVKAQIEEVARASPVGTVLLEFMNSRRKWEGTPSKLHIAMIEHAKELNISTRQKKWPKAPHILVRRLNELTPSLKALGLEIVTGVHTGTTRRILINSVSSVPSVKEDNGGNDGTNATDGTVQSSFRQIMVSIKSWCLAQRNERSEISLLELAKFIQEELKQDPQRVIEQAKKQAILMSSPKPGRAVVM